MGWQTPIYDQVTLDQHYRRVLDALDHGPQSSLDEARAERADDYYDLPAALPHPQAAGKTPDSDSGVGPAALTECRAPGPKTSRKDAA